MRHIVIYLLCIAFAGCSANTTSNPASTGAAPQKVEAAVWDQQTPMGQPLAGKRGAIVQASVLVEKVDLAKRVLTVKKTDGSSVTLKAGPEVKRLNEIKPGDTVVAQFLYAVAYELREPTKDEKAQPLSGAAMAGRNSLEVPPGAGAAAMIHGIVTITAIDREAGTVTIKGPTGEATVLDVKRPENFERIRVGDTAAITYTEAIVLSVEPKKS
jgi:hypothetical protein